MKPLKEHHVAVANLTAAGHSIKAIAHLMNIPQGTIANYRCHVLRYHGCKNAVQLAHKFLHLGNIKNIYATGSNHQR